MATKTINDYSAAVSIDASADYLLIEQAGVYRKINRNVFTGLAGAPVGVSDSQVLSNKTLGNTNTVTLLDTLFTLQDNADATKQLQMQLSGITTGTTRTITVPDADLTLVGLTTTQTLTNKTLTAPVINGGTVSNSTISVDSIAEYTAANGVTIDGVKLKDGALATTNSVVTANITNEAVTPQKLVTGTGTGWSYTSYVPTYANFTLGNGTVSAYYQQIGKRVHYYGVITFGTTTAVTGQMDISLPVNAASGLGDFAPIGTVNVRDTSANAYNPGWGWKADGAQRLRLIFGVASGTYVVATGTTNVIPFTWATNDLIFWDVEYEAA